MGFPEFKGFNKISRLSREIVITEKLDGTNGLIYIDENNNIYAGSRNRWLWGSVQEEIHNDNRGFARWVKDNQEELLKLGQGYHYGEWVGQGIQRNYGLKEKRFYLFNVGRWCNRINGYRVSDGKLQCCPDCCYVVPILYRGNWVLDDGDSIYAPDLFINRLKVLGSCAVPDFMNPEGIVIYHTASGQLFKKTIENDSKGKEQKEQL